MNKVQLQEFRQMVEEAIEERRHLGEYDANARYINILLDNMAKLVDHAISQYPKTITKSKALHKDH